jgi:hypothetical protein
MERTALALRCNATPMERAPTWLQKHNTTRSLVNPYPCQTSSIGLAFQLPCLQCKTRPTERSWACIALQYVHPYGIHGTPLGVAPCPCVACEACPLLGRGWPSNPCEASNETPDGIASTYCATNKQGQRPVQLELVTAQVKTRMGLQIAKPMLQPSRKLLTIP